MVQVSVIKPPWHENLFYITVPLCGNALCEGIMDYPHRGPVIQTFNDVFAFKMNKLLNKLSSY